MKKNISYFDGKEQREREINYIPARYIVSIVVAVLETLAVLAAVGILMYFLPYFYVAVIATQIGVAIGIMASEENPDYRLPWLFIDLLLPVAGFMFYFIFAHRRLEKRRIRELEDLGEQLHQKDSGKELALLKAENADACSQARLICNISRSSLYRNTRVKYFPLGERYYESLWADLKAAEKFIFLEYFIIEEGIFWDSVLAVLKEKAQAGVEVRVVYDDIGTMMTLPGDYAKTLKSYGIDAAIFSKLKGNADSEFNNRSHRKIVVIDGKVGYTGGINMADEYINRKVKYGHWKDGGVRLEGEGVQGLTNLFLSDYGSNVKDPRIKERFYPAAEAGEDDGYVLPFGDGPEPFYARRVGQSAVQCMLAQAEDYVWITTPYLIIDNELCSAIESAALRGVDVKIITPHIPDKKLIFMMTRSFYPRLMKAGVEIYEYEPGFIHAKNYLADDRVGMVGTINLDYRSLVHHFEDAVWMYGCGCLKDLKADMTETREKCIRIQPSMLRQNIFKRIFCAIARVFAPLM